MTPSEPTPDAVPETPPADATPPITEAAPPAAEATATEVVPQTAENATTAVEPQQPTPAAPKEPALPSQPVPEVPPAPQSQDLSRLAQDLQIRRMHVEAVVQLLDEQNTVPFITRYRKERTGGLDEVAIRRIQDRVAALRALRDRKQTILRTIANQGKLNDDLQAAILEADHPKRLEDLYLPYKPKKRSLATEAREKGLEPLAQAIWNKDETVANLAEVLPGMVNPDQKLNTVEDILTGVQHILAEVISEFPDVRGPLRAFTWDTAVLASNRPEGLPEEKGKEFREYFSFKEPVRMIPPHRVLAVNRGEKEQVLKLKFEVDAERAKHIAADHLPLADHTHRDILTNAMVDAVDRLILPSLEREIRRDLTERAQDHAVDVFARNLRGLLLQPPLRGKRVLAIDPGLRTGCKIAALDETGALLEDSVVFPHQPQKKAAEAKRKLEQFIRKYQTPVIAIGNGTACRETEQLVSDLIAELENRRLNPQPTVTQSESVTVEPTTVVPSAVEAAAAPVESVMITPPSISAESFSTMTSTPGEATTVSTPTEATAESVTTTEVTATAVTAEPTAPPPPPAEVIVLDGLPDAPVDLAYVIVNEAGASDYSASPIAKEEFPNRDATTRGTVSIGRRLQDPLAELVKIDPQHVGVGLYQHDLRPKYLKESLEAVIESCVNHIGVDVNTASVPLLRHVSGLNQLAARELVEYRKVHGAFKTREQLKSVPQMGEARFTQAAGFLKINDGDDPLDMTWVHPESYELTKKVLSEFGLTPADLRDKAKVEELRGKLNQANPDEIAQKLDVALPTLVDIFHSVARPGRDPREELPPPVFKKGILKLEDVTPGLELTGTVLNVVPFGAFVDIGVKESGLVHISQMANRYIKSPYEVVAVGDVVKVWVMEVKPGDKKISLSMIPPGQERQPMGRPEPQAERPRREPQQRPQQPQGDRPPRPTGPPRGTRPGAPGAPASRRFDRPRPAPQPPAEATPATPPPPPRPQKPRPVVKLTDEKKAGKAALNTFGELAVFFKARTEPDAPKPEDKKETPPETPPANG
ncbi:Tex-like N-terminal domain-containing protein [Limnoglobus roseus]|uniref:RNA-binding transcriptional accessory protein n=1 Tax=Limnoglobus roseus TaxID=2598579 RepID=A0A5C1AC40_9BACT|nr:Tex family protein [Limnoglobus roseus]QEL16290.1 RNA-binding transcriptional accessory protein [Limnoglobus roseus]